MNIKLILFSVLVSCICSCNQPNATDNVQRVKTKAKDSLDLTFGLPTAFQYHDDKVFIVDLFGEKGIVNIYDLKKKQTLLSFGAKGNGPYEYLHINSIDVYTGKDNRSKLSLFDPVKKRLTIYDIDSLLLEQKRYEPQIKKNQSNIGFHELLAIKEGFIATGRTQEGKYIVLNDSLGVEKITGEYRPKPAENIPDMKHITANYGKSVVSADQNHLLEIIYNASVLSFYKISDGQLNKLWESNLIELDYELQGDNIINRQPVGYISGSITSEKIYALYSGEKENPAAEEIAPYAKEIHIYNLEGKMLSKIETENSLFLISVDEANKVIYGLSHTPTPRIFEYQIP